MPEPLIVVEPPTEEPESPIPEPSGFGLLGGSETHQCDDGTSFECHGGTFGCFENSPQFCSVSGQKECDFLNPSEAAFFSWVFNKEACRCFLVDDIALTPEYCQNEDINKPVENPLEGELCISESAYIDLFNH